MSSKMLAGLVAGGFGAALSITFFLSSLVSPLLAYFLALVLLFGLGVLSGVLAARWLDLSDYGEQRSAGALAGLVAAGVTEVSDLALRLVLASISKASPTTVLSNIVVARLPTSRAVAVIVVMVITNLFLYLMYMLIVISISTIVANFAGRAKTPQALQAMLEGRQQLFSPQAADSPGETLLDPALLPFMRPEYSPFAPEAPPDSEFPWQPRRVERKGPSAEKRSQPTPQRRQSGGFNPPGAPARGATSGPAPRKPPISLPQLPSNTQRPRPRSKD
jgi:hypothetical protein